MALPRRQAQIRRVGGSYKELNYPETSLHYDELRKDVNEFFEGYRAQNGRSPEDFTSMARSDKPITQQFFAEMARKFAISMEKGVQFWPCDPNSATYNGLRFTVQSENRRILSFLAQLFYRKAWHRRHYTKLKRNRGHINPDEEDEEEHEPDTNDSRAQSIDLSSPDADHPAASFWFPPSGFQPTVLVPQNVFNQEGARYFDTTGAQNATTTARSSSGAADFRGDPVGPSEVINLLDQCSPSDNTRREEGDEGDSSAQRSRAQEASTPRRKTTFGRTRAENHGSPVGKRCSSRNRTQRVLPDVIPEAEADELIDAAARLEREMHQANEFGQAKQPHPVTFESPKSACHEPVPPTRPDAQTAPVAPLAPMDLPHRVQEVAQTGVVQPRARGSLNITTSVVLSAGRANKNISWEPETSVPGMTLPQLEEQVPKILDLKKSGFTLKSLKLTLGILDADREYFEHDVPRGQVHRFDLWKTNVGGGIKRGIARLKHGEVLGVTIEVQALVDGQEAESEMVDELDEGFWN